MRERAKHVVLITLDAVNAEDFEYLKTLPNLSYLCKNGAYSTRLKTIYPSETYPVHATISSGRYPAVHCITHNKPFAPNLAGDERPWYWHRSEIKALVFYEEAKKQGVSTALIMWPTACGANVNILLPEILAIKGENQVTKIIKYSSKPFIFTSILKVRRHITGVTQPHIDKIMVQVAKHVILSKKPGLTMMHLFGGDSQKHKGGVYGDKTKEALVRYDAQIGEIVGAVKQAGIFGVTAFVVVSDHGQRDTQFTSYLNNLFLREGLLTSDGSGIKTWNACADSCGTSAAIYTDGSRETDAKIGRLLSKAKEDGEFGIEQVFDRADLDKMHYGKGPSFAVEAKSGFRFSDKLNEKDVMPIQNAPRGEHGDLPEKEHNRCIFIASGSGVVRGGEIGAIDMVDIAPTVMMLLGLSFSCDGRPLTEIAK